MISVITPVYNGEKSIESCILNVIDQNYPDIEHVIIDGASTDRTIEIVKEYVEKYNHIRWISEKDKGISDAMNKGIAMAKGNIISFLCVDDFYEKGTLNFVSKLFRHLPCPSFLAGNCNILDEKDKIIFVNKPNHLELKDLLMPRPIPMNPSAYFYHKEIHQEAGLFDTTDHYSMDIDFVLRAVTCANLKYVNITFGNFRLTKGKTFDTIKNGTQKQIAAKILYKYRKNLPFFERIKLPFRQFYIHNFEPALKKRSIKTLFNLTPYYLR